MKIYLAGRVSKRPTLQTWASELEAMGHEIVSRWSKVESDHVGCSDTAPDDDRERFAREDLEDIQACDCVLSLMDEPRSTGRGGRHVEFGYALALGKRMMIVGCRETVFHHLPNVEHYNTFEEAISNHLIDTAHVSHRPRKADATIAAIQRIQDHATRELEYSLKTAIGMILEHTGWGSVAIHPNIVPDFHKKFDVFITANPDGATVYNLARKQDVH